jgi:hypothetical protein
MYSVRPSQIASTPRRTARTAPVLFLLLLAACTREKADRPRLEEPAVLLDQGSIEWVAPSADGRYLAWTSCRDVTSTAPATACSLKLWDSQDRSSRELLATKGPLPLVVWSPSGHRLLAEVDGGQRMHEVGGGWIIAPSGARCEFAEDDGGPPIWLYVVTGDPGAQQLKLKLVVEPEG